MNEESNMTREEREMDLWRACYERSLAAMSGVEISKAVADESLAAFRAAFPASERALSLSDEPHHLTDARAGLHGCVDSLNPPKVPRPL
jgi:hypothetical protein